MNTRIKSFQNSKMNIRNVKIVSLVVIVLNLLASHYSYAQVWDTYVTEINGKSVGVTLNMELADYAPLEDYPYLLKVTNQYKDKTEDGFPTEKAFSKLTKITVELIQKLNEQMPTIYAGSYTYNGKSTDFIYLSSKQELNELMDAFYADNFKNIKYSFDVSDDALWKEYLDFLYPNETILNYMTDNKVIQNLLDNGDDLTIERRVSHWLYFKNREDLDNFGDRIQEYNFYVSDISDSEY